MMAMLEAKQLGIVRGGTRVLDRVSFRVEQRQVFALLGGNGAGKSTTLLAFLGLLPLHQGEVRAAGQSVHQDIAAARTRMTYLPESAALYSHLTPLENLHYFLSLAGVRCTAVEQEAALARVGLQSAAWNQPVASCSKGMRQKTAIAMALLRRVPILLLDEPTSGLDPVAIDEFNQLVGELASGGSTVLMVTHDVYGACQVADRIGLLQGGNIVGLFEREGERKIETETVHAAFQSSAARLEHMR